MDIQGEIMKRRVSFLVMLILAVALVFTLSACGECDHKQTETRKEVTLQGNCQIPERYDSVVYCVDCDAEISRTSEIGALGAHTPGTPVYENYDLVDCTVGGTCEKVIYCSNQRCNALIERVKIDVAPVAAHNLESQIIFRENHLSVKEVLEYCTDCTYRASRALTAEEREKNKTLIDKAKESEHDYDANVCIYCNLIDSTTANLKYEENGNGYTLVGLRNTQGAVPQNLRIGYYNGKPVTKIAADAFKNVTGIRYLSIGSCVKEIGADAFAGCRLENVIIYDLNAWCKIKFANVAANPISVSKKFSPYEDIQITAYSTFSTMGIKNISGTYTFAGLKASTVHIAADTELVGEGTFANCNSLLYVHIDGTAAKTVGKDAFLNCESIKTVYDKSSDTGYLSATANPAYYAEALIVNDEILNGKVLKIKDGTTKINAYAYAGLDIVGVEIPASVTEISSGAFAECNKLATVKFLGDNPALITVGNSAFKGCAALTSITIPKNTASIGANAFENCSALGEVYVSDTVTSVGNGAFKGCSALTSIKLPANLTVLSSEIFADCSALKDIELGENIEEIAGYAFLNCVSLSAFEFSANINSVAEGAFKGCTAITEIKFNDGLNTIGASAFEDCLNLKGIGIPNSVDSVGLGAFKGCNSVKNVYVSFVGETKNVSSHNTHFGYIFGAKVAEENRASVPSSIENVIITGDVISIDAYAFSGCESIVTIELPSTVKSMGAYAFEGCSSLKEVRILDLAAWLGISFANYCANPLTYAGSLYETKVVDEKTEYVLIDKLNLGGIEKVNPYAFYGATSLKSIVVGDGVKTVGNDAFYGCDNVCAVAIAATVESVGARAFFSCDSIDTVYFSSYEAWCGIDFADMFANPLCYIDYVDLTDESTNPERIFVNNVDITKIVDIDPNPDVVKRVALVDVQIPASVTKINAYAFAGCEVITSITFLGEANLTEICNFAFYGCKNVVSLTLPASCVTVGNGAFDSCSALTEVNLKNVQTIGDRAFANCSAITKIVIPDTTVTIGKEAFSGCCAVTELTLGASLKTIGTSAFYGCAIACLKIPATVKKIGAHAFCECPINAVTFDMAEGWIANGAEVSKDVLLDAQSAVQKFIALTDFEWVRA